MSAARAQTRVWLLFAVGVLMAAGATALIPLIGRLPPFDRLITDPVFFRRGLVVHVNLSLVLWFTSFMAALLATLPGAGAPWTRAGAPISAGGVALLCVAAGIPGAEPILSNYVPMIDHPLFVAGHVLFGFGLLLSLADARLVAAGEGWMALRPESIPGVRVAGVALVLAALTFLGSWLSAPVGATPEVYWELVNWGGGHVLQLASTAAMVAVWLHMLGGALGRPVISRGISVALFALLLLPWMAAPLVTLWGTQDIRSHATFTELMRFGIFPVVSVFLLACLRALRQAHQEGRLGRASLRDPRVTGFLVSAALTVVGWILGACIRGSNTMVPAHYHANIGAVTASFMAMSWVLLDAVGWPLPSLRARRLAAVQAPLFGVGQLVFALGFALAGAQGMMRKAYGSEQAGRDALETLGLAVMGAGGLMAVAGGLLFLWIAVACVRARAPAGARSIPLTDISTPTL